MLTVAVDPRKLRPHLIQSLRLALAEPRVPFCYTYPPPQGYPDQWVTIGIPKVGAQALLVDLLALENRVRAWAWLFAFEVPRDLFHRL
jgi:hypothetical protein